MLDTIAIAYFYSYYYIYLTIPKLINEEQAENQSSNKSNASPNETSSSASESSASTVPEDSQIPSTAEPSVSSSDASNEEDENSNTRANEFNKGNFLKDVMGVLKKHDFTREEINSAIESKYGSENQLETNNAITRTVTN